MTNFKLDHSYIGVAYELIVDHVWTTGSSQQYGYSADVSKDNVRKWINDIVRATKAYDDRRNMQLYWSPDGYMKIPIENVERGFDLHEHSWSDGAQAQSSDQYVALIGDVVDGITAYDLHEHQRSDGAQAQSSDQYVALIGDVVDGITVYGPFSDGEAASDWAREDDNAWTVAPMQVPE